MWGGFLPSKYGVMTSPIVLVGRCQPCTPPSPMPIVPSSQWMRISSQRFHRRVSTCSILVGFAMGGLRRVLIAPFEKSLLYLAHLGGRGYTYYAWPRSERLLSSKWGG